MTASLPRLARALVTACVTLAACSKPTPVVGSDGADATEAARDAAADTAPVAPTAHQPQRKPLADFWGDYRPPRPVIYPEAGKCSIVLVADVQSQVMIRVTIDGRAAGWLPFEASDLRPGNHVVTMGGAGGYETKVWKLSCKPGDRFVFDEILSKLPVDAGGAG